MIPDMENPKKPGSGEQAMNMNASARKHQGGSEEECLEDKMQESMHKNYGTLGHAITDKMGLLKLNTHAQLEKAHEQVVSAGTHRSSIKKLASTTHCKKSANHTKSHMERPLQQIQRPHIKTNEVDENPLTASPSPSGISVSGEQKMITSLPKDGNHPRHSHHMRNGLVISGVLAVVLSLVFVVWYRKTRKRAWVFRQLKDRRRGRTRGNSVGPWDERAEEGFVMYESDGFED
jgi:hypothetical protein